LIDTALNVVSIFTDNMAMGTSPAFDQMAEVIQVGNTQYWGIYDPISKETSQSFGGIEESNTTNVYIQKSDFNHSNIKKGDKVTFIQHQGSVHDDEVCIFKGRVHVVINDDTDILTLQCGGLLKGVVPRL
jgi:hypothetical protein